MSQNITIALSCSAPAAKRLFTPAALDQLRSMGTLIQNPDADEPSPDRLAELAADADILITSWGSPCLTEELMAKLPKLKFVAHAAGSVKPIVSDGLWARGVRVISSAKVLGMGVAETALGYTIASVKNLFGVSRSLAAGGWHEEYDNIREMFELKIGVVGGGMAGSHYMKLLSMFDVDILLYDPFITAEQAQDRFHAQKVTLEELLAQADVVSIHAPSIPETHHMFNRDSLKLMKKDATLINTARGTIIDEAALAEHMKAGNLKFACLDVFDPEPPLKDNPLRAIPNCILSPHLAGLTHNGLMRIGAHCAGEIRRYLNGEPLLTETTQAQQSKSA